MQCRVNMETMAVDGTARPGGGVLTEFEVPSGKGYRTDSFGYIGYRTSASFDSLLAKVIVHTPSRSLPDAFAKADRALAELRVEGVPTNIGFLQAVVNHPAVRAGTATTRFVDEHMAELVEAAVDQAERHVVSASAPAAAGGPGGAPRLAGVKVDTIDPLAILDFGRSGAGRPAAGLRSAEQLPAMSPGRSGHDVDGPPGTSAVRAPLQGTVVAIDVADGDPVAAGQQLLVMEAMKMEHTLIASGPGVIADLRVRKGDRVRDGDALLVLQKT